jgi:hypothetical protein
MKCSSSGSSFSHPLRKSLNSSTDGEVFGKSCLCFVGFHSESIGDLWEINTVSLASPLLSLSVFLLKLKRLSLVLPRILFVFEKLQAIRRLCLVFSSVFLLLFLFSLTVFLRNFDLLQESLLSASNLQELFVLI